jgi:hypothetical protein
MGKVTGTNKLIDKKYGIKAVSYENYKKLVTDLLADNKVTGPIQSPDLIEYTKLNIFRMHRIEKTIQVLPEVKSIVENIATPQTWLVVTEGWCGDAAQTIPVMNALAILNENIKLIFLLRDENPELMDHYRTNGSSSIPRLIVYNTLTNEEIFNWGPRPAELQNKFNEMKKNGLPYDDIKEEIHRLYAKDHTISTQNELSSLLIHD